jgi:uncharacterized protein
MNKSKTVQSVLEEVKTSFQDMEGSHDWWHTERVLKMAKYIARKEAAEMFIVQLAALLHDIADWKFADSFTAGSKKTRIILERYKIPEEIIVHVCEIVDGVSYKGAGVPTLMQTIEGQVVQDADRLEAMGAIGIARCFAYGGSRGRPIYDPMKKATRHNTKDEYKASNSPSINHFYEKLLLLKDRMNTKTGKKIAENRHHFMEKYLEEFYKEWNGER